MHSIKVIPIATNLQYELCTNKETMSTTYLAPMHIFLKWVNHEPEEMWTIDVPHGVTKCKKYIKSVISDSNPRYIKFVKTVGKTHIYIALFDANCRFKDNPTCFPSTEDWKWRTFYNFFKPWPPPEIDETHNILPFGETDSEEEEPIMESIDVFEFIMDEPGINKLHMEIKLPFAEGSESFITFKDLCEALLNTDVKKLSNKK